MQTQDALSSVRAAIHSERRHIASEISEYPTPISGCDAQFNHLLDLRRRLERALAELDRPEWIPTARFPDR